jgi:serine/threonine protein kinase
VLLVGPSKVVLSDFGLALPAGSAHLGASEGYVSPERLAGAGASPADDVFALGRILERVVGALGGRGGSDGAHWLRAAQRLTASDRPRDARAALPLLPQAGPGPH